MLGAGRVGGLAKERRCTAVLVAQAILSHAWSVEGVAPPEHRGANKALFEDIIRGLRGLGIAINTG